MRYEELRGVKIPKVGFGTWNIGGGMAADRSRDAASLSILRSALDLGYTHFDTAESYADGHCEELLGRAIRDAGVNRRDLFLTSKVRAGNLSAEDVRKACEGSLRRLGTPYLDLYLIHWPSPAIPLQDTFRGLDQLVKEGKVRHIGVSNFDLPTLLLAADLSATPIMTNQVPYSLHERTYARNGVLGYCQSADIILTAYSPLKGRARPHDAKMKAIASRHKITPNQLAIAWLCTQPRVITIPMSSSPDHQRANLEAADIILPADELEIAEN